MANRKKTPDILGDLLGGGRLPNPQSKTNMAEGEQAQLPIPEKDKPASRKKTNKSKEADVEYFEGLLYRGAGALELVAEVLGRRRLIEWLDDMKAFFGGQESSSDKKGPSLAFKQKVASWAENYLSAETTTIGYLANGLSATDPYEIDVWGHLKGESSRNDLEIWIECREGGGQIVQEDIFNFVKMAVDVFEAAHTIKQEFWFDRLMMVSSVPFDDSALSFAKQEGVVCILSDGSGYQLLTEENWRLKPSWLRKAENGESYPCEMRSG